MQAASPLFSARLTPHRSLTPRARTIVVGMVALLSAIPGIIFFSMGAWPVVGFMGLDVLAIWAALTWATSGNKRREQITLWPEALEILTTGPKGATTRQTFNPFAVRLVIDRDFEERTQAMRLRTKDGDVEIGAFLHADDKASFAKVFGTALRKARIAGLKDHE